MAASYTTDDSFVNSIVGEGTRFRGDIELDGLLRIDGDFSGTIRSAGKVLVGKNGRAECTIHAGTIVVGGIVKGDLYSTEKVIVLSSGMIIGNIYAPRLIAEEGVVIDGGCVINAQRQLPYEVSRKNGIPGQNGGAVPRIFSLDPREQDRQIREFPTETADGDLPRDAGGRKIGS